jgi:hypothetical protein
MRCLLLHLYPPAWRARYGDELDDLIATNLHSRRLPVYVDVVRAAARERLRAAAGGPQRDERIRAGSLLVLCSWMVFVVGGLGVAKYSEHWQLTNPAADGGVSAVAFDVLRVAAGIGSLLVLAGILATRRSVAALLRDGGWRAIRRPLVTAALLTVVAAAATAALVAWAHVLTAPQRNGRDLLYSLAFVAWALVCVGCLGAWTVAAVATARRLTLTAATLRLEAWLTAGVTGSMVLMTAATLTWWVSLAPVSVPPLLLGCVTLMLAATALGGVGAMRALRA